MHNKAVPNFLLLGFFFFFKLEMLKLKLLIMFSPNFICWAWDTDWSASQSQQSMYWNMNLTVVTENIWISNTIEAQPDDSCLCLWLKMMVIKALWFNGVKKQVNYYAYHFLEIFHETSFTFLLPWKNFFQVFWILLWSIKTPDA